MITYKQKNLITSFKEGEVNIIAHGCNTCCGMGAGIAKLIAKEFPITGILDKGFRKHGIGKALMIETDYGFIFNLYAQINVYYSKEETFENRKEFLEYSLLDMKPYLKLTDKIGIPLIHSGLAANKELKSDLTDLEYFKKFIEPIVEKTIGEFNVVVYYI